MKAAALILALLLVGCGGPPANQRYSVRDLGLHYRDGRMWRVQDVRYYGIWTASRWDGEQGSTVPATCTVEGADEPMIFESDEDECYVDRQQWGEP